MLSGIADLAADLAAGPQWSFESWLENLEFASTIAAGIREVLSAELGHSVGSESGEAQPQLELGFMQMLGSAGNDVAQKTVEAVLHQANVYEGVGRVIMEAAVELVRDYEAEKVAMSLAEQEAVDEEARAVRAMQMKRDVARKMEVTRQAKDEVAAKDKAQETARAAATALLVTAPATAPATALATAPATAPAIALVMPAAATIEPTDERREQLEAQRQLLEGKEGDFADTIEKLRREHRKKAEKREREFAEEQAKAQAEFEAQLQEKTDVHGSEMQPQWDTYKVQRHEWVMQRRAQQQLAQGKGQADSEAAVLTAVDKSNGTSDQAAVPAISAPALGGGDGMVSAEDALAFNEGAAAELSWRLLYGEVGLVFHGLDKLIGEADVEAGDDEGLMTHMLREHEEMQDSHSWFTPTNYPIETTSFLEWWIVVDPSDKQLMHLGRQRPALYGGIADWPMAQRDGNSEETVTSRGLPMVAFRQKWNALNSRLDAEMAESPLRPNGFVSLRLYTGPLYVKYNAVLRGLPPGLNQKALPALADRWHQLCKSNTYMYTLHAITAAISKLSRLTRVTKLYRGPGGVTPKSFWEEDVYGCTGGVEMALMSCSKSKDEALKYVRRSAAKLLFEVHQGMAARGAEISWLSQFPAEDEGALCRPERIPPPADVMPPVPLHTLSDSCVAVLFAPLTALEVKGTRVEGRVLVIEIRPNAAKVSLQERSLDIKRRERAMQVERERQLVQSSLAKRHWIGSLKSVRVAKTDLEAKRTKQALVAEARNRGRMLKKQHTEMKEMNDLKAFAEETEAALQEKEREARELVEQAEVQQTAVHDLFIAPCRHLLLAHTSCLRPTLLLPCVQLELEKQRQQALKYDAVSQRMASTQGHLKRSLNVKERLAMRLIQVAMRTAVARRRLAKAEIERDTLEMERKRLAKRGVLHRMATAKSLTLAQGKLNSAGNDVDIDEIIAERTEEMQAVLEAKQAEIDEMIAGEEKRKKAMKVEIEKEIKKDIKEEMTEKYEAKLKKQKEMISSLREEIHSQVDQIEKLRTGKK